MSTILYRLGACALLTTLVVGCVSAEAPRKSEGQASGGEVAARVGETTITLKEVDARAMAGNAAAYQALYDARHTAVQELIAQKLLAQEAESRGVTVSELTTLEVTQNVRPITDGDVENYYNANKARLRGQTLEQVGSQIRRFLESQSAGRAQQEYMDQLKAKAKVRVMLEPPRTEVKIAANDPSIGPDSAAVTIVEFSDFQ